MEQPRDVSQLRAFLGCCQQLSNYVKDYATIAQPLHQLTKKNSIFPKPWVPGTVYDIGFHRMKSAMLGSPKYLWNKDPNKRLFIETDASDLGWGACAYQFENQIPPGTEDEGQYRLQNDMDKPKRIIEWLSKAWTLDQLKLPVFHRESLARLLMLHKFRNLIETNYDAGVTVFSDQAQPVQG